MADDMAELFMATPLQRHTIKRLLEKLNEFSCDPKQPVFEYACIYMEGDHSATFRAKTSLTSFFQVGVISDAATPNEREKFEARMPDVIEKMARSGVAKFLADEMADELRALGWRRKGDRE